MNKILFDGIATQSSDKVKYHGGSEYAKFILKYALENNYRNFDFVYSADMLLHDDVREMVEKFNIKTICLKKSSELQRFILGSEYTCFYSALPYGYGDFDLGDILFIFTIHGCRALELPSDSYRHYYTDSVYSSLIMRILNPVFRLFTYYVSMKSFRHLLNVKNKKIITVSNHSKYSLMSFFSNVNFDDLIVSYSPIDFSIKEYTDKVDIEGDFFLLISSNRFEKNAYRAILALDCLFSENRLEKKKVLVLGCVNCSLITKVANKDRFVFMGYVPKNKLVSYFKSAFAFVYPTLNEGFGYPPVMAMQYGVPVICSAVTSIPEICADGACYFNPYDINEIKNRILYVSEDADYRQRLINNGYRRSSELQNLQKLNMDYLMECIFVKN
ncbi:glycosyltransferase [Bacteroides hominis]|uniref:glycosyltransferase n=1 Tax=Bacteroides hominis TaxID=2763023 RepID=UPI00294950EF|nr:glycosyltransferase [Bacteroides hominis (ex Liu et al. 2022)]MDV6187430.1 glycosyltransferase [Bacteroides hominis (ex Liu et al. 2022)]